MNAPRDSLSQALQAWRVRPPADPGFRPAVWQRINRPHDSWSSYLRAHRLGWSMAAMLAVAAAGWSGHAAAQSKLAAARTAMAETYLVGLDPRVQAKLHPQH